MITNSSSLIRELQRMGDNFITVSLYGTEYIIDSISRKSNISDQLNSHIVLNVRDGGNGNILR